jgi:HEPN domain-containing protein
VEGHPITGSRQADYRLKLARGFLEEARQDTELERWRSAVDGAQLPVGNASKAGLAMAGRIGRTHNPTTRIRRVIEEGRLGPEPLAKLRRPAELSELLGPDIHIQTDYCDETEGRTPWELFTGEDARQTLAIAEEAVGLAEDLIRRFSS